jgi:hypothetical protein
MQMYCNFRFPLQRSNNCGQAVLRTGLDRWRDVQPILVSPEQAKIIRSGVRAMLKRHFRRVFSVSIYLAVAALLLYPGLILIQLDLVNSRIMFPALALIFLISSPPSLMRR